jgi:hypothetical protein
MFAARHITAVAASGVKGEYWLNLIFLHPNGMKIIQPRVVPAKRELPWEKQQSNPLP